MKTLCSSLVNTSLFANSKLFNSSCLMREKPFYLFFIRFLNFLSFGHIELSLKLKQKYNNLEKRDYVLENEKKKNMKRSFRIRPKFAQTNL